MDAEAARNNPAVQASAHRQNFLQISFVMALMLSALLMFFVQPIVGKTLLPALGGAPQVWNTCMVFFQTMLFAGYLHAHYTGVIIGLKRQAIVHLGVALAALIFLPFGVTEDRLLSPDPAHPVLWLMKTLFLSVGVPVFLIAATAPLLQKWFANSRHSAAEDPYFLYAASNFGSLLALILYPTVMEPFSNLEQQWVWWSGGFAFFVGLLFVCALLLKRNRRAALNVRREPLSIEGAAAVTNGLRLRWLLLSFVPSSLMLGVTTFITTDIASVPLFWIVPLALYLVTFILAFSTKQFIPGASALRVQAFVIALLSALSMIPGIAIAIAPVFILMHLAAFFFTALVCHGELVRARPHASKLTEFYLWLSLGGLLGGVFNALIAPIVFTHLIEYLLVLALACAVRPRVANDLNKLPYLFDLILPVFFAAFILALLYSLPLLGASLQALGKILLVFVVVLAAIVLLSFSSRPLRFSVGVAMFVLVLPNAFTPFLIFGGGVEYAARSFFGVYKITRNDEYGLNVFSHGTTVHGVQYRDSVKSMQPAAYYHQEGAFGDLFSAMAQVVDDRPVAVVGLGVGGLACYGERGSTWTFYEIDPLVEDVARDERFFTFLRDCPPAAHVVIGDARVTLSRAPDHSLSMIIIDAFSSDSIPTHLLTKEAVAVYRKKLSPDGVLAFHISNRYLRLAPVVGNLAQDAGLVGLVNVPEHSGDKNLLLASPAELVVLAADESLLGPLLANPKWVPLQSDQKARVWTDGYVNILGALR